MTLKVYCDTNVYLDFFLERDTTLVPHSQFAWNIFSLAYQRKIILIYSDHLEFQIKKELGDKWKLAQGFFRDLKDRNAVEEVKVTDEIRKESKRYLPNREDAIHALLAIKTNASVLVTRNIGDFEPFKQTIKIVTPTDFEI